MAQDPRRIAVVQDRADVQLVPAVEDVHFGALGRRAALDRFLLDELAGGLGLIPGRLGQPAVQLDALLRPEGHGADGAQRGRLLFLLSGSQHRRCRQEKAEGEDDEWRGLTHEDDVTPTTRTFNL